MLDSFIRPVVAPVLEQMAQGVVKMGYTPRAMTICGTVAGLLCFAVLAAGLHGLAIFFLLLNRLFDGLDGAVARWREKQNLPGGVSDLGGYFDIVTDFIFYSGFVFFYALGIDQPAAGALSGFLLFSYMGTSTTFLAFAILAAKHGITDPVEPSRTMFYLGGLTGGTETAIAMLLMCLAPIAFPVIALVFGLMCWLTTYGRIRMAVAAFGSR